MSNKKPFYPVHRVAQLLLNTILAPAQCRMDAAVVVRMQQHGATLAGRGRDRQILPPSGPVKDWQIH
ncbi:hypothetical protein [Massilia sp. Bi118]|uniref:hypothetical protein n=1 Tax=Massilia sp. Bi118 TaxID=2822346 RepID=UPI001E54CD39|nr:hypothetical protein [Massilia sp. Bi118]